MASLAMQSALLAALAIGAAAQERRASLVVVRDAAGQPVAGASVTCCGAPWFLDLDGEDDFWHATTNRDGRAIVHLLPQRRYELCAAVVDGERCAVSAVHEWLIAGAEAILALGEPRPRRRVTVEGADAWLREGPLRVQVSPTQEGGFFLDLPGDGALPPMPDLRRFRVLDRDASPLLEGGVGPLQLGAADGGVVAQPSHELKLPFPRLFAMRAVDERGKAVAGVRLWQKVPADMRTHPSPREVPSQRGWRLLGETDARGMLASSLMLGSNLQHLHGGLLIEARAAGRATARVEVRQPGQIVCNGIPQAIPDDYVLPFVLQPAQQLILQPAQRYDVTLFGKLPGITPNEHPIRLQTGADGVASLPCLRHPQAVRAALIRREEHEPPVWSVVEQHGQCRATLAPRAVTLRVLDGNGAPTRDATAWLTFLRSRGQPFDLPLAVDVTGNIDVRLNAGAWCVWVRRGDLLAWRVIEEAEQDVDDILRLAPLPFGELRLVDGSGAPVSGERCTISVAHKWDKRLRTIRERFLCDQLGSLRQLWSGERVADAAGLVRVPMLPLPGVRADVRVRPWSWPQGQDGVVTVRPADAADFVVR